MKAVVAAFNQKKALVGAFSVITNLQMELFQALLPTLGPDKHPPRWGRPGNMGQQGNYKSYIQRLHPGQAKGVEWSVGTDWVLLVSVSNQQ